MAAAPPALSDALRGRFAFERELGRGGMGLVFLARDLRHHRQVALKLIRPELASVVGAERFSREIQLAAQLQHPNIVPVYESGECESTLYYVVPYVEGESLRARLQRDGQLPLTDAFQIARGVALCDEAARLDPRSPLVARRYVYVLDLFHRYRAADSIGSAALKTAPDNLALLHFVTAARLQQGDVPGARAVLHEAVAHVPARRLVMWVDFRVFLWLMDDSLRALALRLPPDAFDEVRAVGLMRIAEINWDQGRYGAARASAAMARSLLEQRLQQRPADTGRMLKLMTAYAYLGKCAEARQLRERVRAAGREDSASVEMATDRFDIAVRCGDNARAVAWADTLIRRRWATPAWFRVHPAYTPLRGRPDFKRLVAEK